jgi:hypothetical protein
MTAMENLPTDTGCREAAIARWDDDGGARLTESGRRSRHIDRLEQPSYRIVPQALVRFGVEVSEPNKPPRVVLTCSTEAAAETWVAELERLWAAKAQFDQIVSIASTPVAAREKRAPWVADHAH